jgi:hypothetical protein
MVDSRIKWDVNLASAGIFVDNSFFYIPGRQLPPFGFKKIADEINDREVLTHFNPSRPNQLYHFVSSAETIGPSFFMPLNYNSQIGFTIAARGYANLMQVPGHLAQNTYTNLKDPSLWNTEWQDTHSKVNSMAWLEYGLHYGRVLYRRNNKKLLMGVSLKYLQGIVAAYAKNTNLNYTIIDSNEAMLSHSSVDYGGTREFSGKKYSDLIHGSGFAGGLGLTFVSGGPSACNANPDAITENESGNRYVYKIGISLIDLGNIRFNRYSAAYYLRADSAVYTGNGQSNSGSSGPIAQFVYENDSAKHLTANHFNMVLPSAISVQADWNVFNDYYINATVIKGFGHGNHTGVVRPDLYSVTPRYETSWFEVSAPFSLLYYQRWQPRIGIAFRIGYFFFGGDAPASLAGIGNFERTDIYAGIHFFPLEWKHRPSGLLCPDVKN